MKTLITLTLALVFSGAVEALEERFLSRARIAHCKPNDNVIVIQVPETLDEDGNPIVPEIVVEGAPPPEADCSFLDTSIQSVNSVSGDLLIWSNETTFEIEKMFASAYVSDGHNVYAFGDMIEMEGHNDNGARYYGKSTTRYRDGAPVRYEIDFVRRQPDVVWIDLPFWYIVNPDSVPYIPEVQPGPEFGFLMKGDDLTTMFQIVRYLEDGSIVILNLDYRSD